MSSTINARNRREFLQKMSTNDLLLYETSKAHHPPNGIGLIAMDSMDDKRVVRVKEKPEDEAQNVPQGLDTKPRVSQVQEASSNRWRGIQTGHRLYHMKRETAVEEEAPRRGLKAIKGPASCPNGNGNGNGTDVITTLRMASPPCSVTSSSDIKSGLNADELRRTLMPSLEKVYRQFPESVPFREPVDPQALKIPDYFDIIKKPMDLSTIRRKLDSGQYQDPWGYVEDFWLMFSNAWIYNKKLSHVSRCCSKLADIFGDEINPLMQRLGYCCGNKFSFTPPVLHCFGQESCIIPRGAKFMHFETKIYYCIECFSRSLGDYIEIKEIISQQLGGIRSLPKSSFIECKNDRLEDEPFVDCKECGKRFHPICVLHSPFIWTEGFVCDSCLKCKGEKRRENPFRAQKLPQNRLCSHIEKRVKSFLRKRQFKDIDVVIRVVSSGDKSVEVKPLTRESGWPESFPYTAKSLFAFQELDGVDVCFFGMNVQEFGSDCDPPNARRVYISYLDSVNFFRPHKLRTEVYQEIVLGYLEFVKKQGYRTGHIWACPPAEGDDYIFYCHPHEQKIPKADRLIGWYKALLDKGLREGIVIDYKNILKHAKKDGLKSALELPYFDGDFWPNVIEDTIASFDNEQQNQTACASKRPAFEATAVSASAETPKALHHYGHSPSKGLGWSQYKGCNKRTRLSTEDNERPNKLKKQSQKKCGKNKKLEKKATLQKKSESSLIQSLDKNRDERLLAKIMETMEFNQDVFLVIRLNSNHCLLPPVKDVDPFVNCDLMNSRDVFMNLQKEQHYEFSTLRRAMYSTMALLYEWHNYGKSEFNYICNLCNTRLLERRHHCLECEDYDLCVFCFATKGHEHRMEKVDFPTQETEEAPFKGPRSSRCFAKSLNSPEARLEYIRFLQLYLVHACHCREAKCPQSSCSWMKNLMQHMRGCEKKKPNISACNICRQLVALCCLHAKDCQESKCPVMLCFEVKQKLEEQRFLREQTLRRRVASTMKYVMLDKEPSQNPNVEITL